MSPRPPMRHCSLGLLRSLGCRLKKGSLLPLLAQRADNPILFYIIYMTSSFIFLFSRWVNDVVSCVIGVFDACETSGLAGSKRKVKLIQVCSPLSQGRTHTGLEAHVITINIYEHTKTLAVKHISQTSQSIEIIFISVYFIREANFITHLYCNHIESLNENFFFLTAYFL